MLRTALRRSLFAATLAAIPSWPSSVASSPLTAEPAAAVPAATQLTPAQRRVAVAKRACERQPRAAQPLAELAVALARRARESADPAYYAEAEAALDAALRLEPGHFEALKARVWVCLGRHEFAAALALAQELHARVPDDLMVSAYLTDAYVELGRYDEAERSAQWMLDLRPGNVPGLTRAAYLRELFGDLDGALEFMTQALDRTPPDETEDRAWILTHVAHLHLERGALEPAEAAVDEALRLFPDYHYALAQQARLRTLQGRTDAAVALWARRHTLAPHPENLFDLAVALERAGRRADARQAYARFSEQARAESAAADNANRELVRYYAGPGRDPAAALRLARAERTRRADIDTRAAEVVALQAAGHQAAARRELEALLALGVRRAELLQRAGVLALAAGDRAAARRHFEAALALNPHSEEAREARRALRRLGGA